MDIESAPVVKQKGENIPCREIVTLKGIALDPFCA
jgi:hypothetical protein